MGGVGGGGGGGGMGEVWESRSEGTGMEGVRDGNRARKEKMAMKKKLTIEGWSEGTRNGRDGMGKRNE